MTEFTAISRERHAALRWRRPRNFAFAAKEATASLVAAELSSAVSTMPIAFVARDDGFQLVAVLSPAAGKNLFVGPDGNWLAGYTPAAFRAHPFRLLRAEGMADLVLCVDEQSGLLSSDEGEEFFDSEGNPSSALKAMLHFQNQVEQSRSQTAVAVQALTETGVIIPWPIKTQTTDGEHVVNGLHRIDENALNSLSNERFALLRASGALPVAYGQMFSLGQISIFATLARLQAQMAPKSPAPLPSSLDALFDRDERLELKFD